MSTSFKNLSRGSALVLAAGLVMPGASFAQKSSAAQVARIKPETMGIHQGGYYGPQPGSESIDLNMYQRIRTEAAAHGKALEYASVLCDDIGPRLTGSPNLKRANDWTRETLAKIGLANGHLEDWGEFGMGWYQINTWGRIVTPDPEPIWMEAAPWSAATNGPVSGEIVYAPLADAGQLDTLKRTLKEKVLLLGAVRPMPELDQPLSYRRCAWIRYSARR
jgi:hypothetical protein